MTDIHFDEKGREPKFGVVGVIASLSISTLRSPSEADLSFLNGQNQ